MSVSVQVIDEHGTKCGLKINFELLPLKGLAQLERLSKGMNAPLQPTNIEATLDNFVQYLRPRLDGRFQYEHDGYVVIISSTFEVLFDWQAVSGEVRHILSNAGIQVAGGNHRDGVDLSVAARRAELVDIADPDELPPPPQEPAIRWPFTDHHGFGPATVTHASKPWE